MKIIFLDIDGVLNSYETMPKGERGGIIGIHAPLVRRFLNLLEATGAKVVLSSTWRKSDDWLEVMEANGLPKDIFVGRTGSLYRKNLEGLYRGSELRGEEIDAWLAQHPETTRYAIIDDDSDFLPHQPHFRTSLFEGGLTDPIVWRIIQHFAYD